MRYGKEHKAETHRRVVEAAARRFRRNGIEATGVVDLMADAGLTHGGFYAHFPSKETLVREAVQSASAQGRRHFQRQIEQARAEGREPLETIVRQYLTTLHRDRPDRGCSIAALGAEIARHPRKTREAFTEGLEEDTRPDRKCAPLARSRRRQGPGHCRVLDADRRPAIVTCACRFRAVAAGAGRRCEGGARNWREQSRPQRPLRRNPASPTRKSGA